MWSRFRLHLYKAIPNPVLYRYLHLPKWINLAKVKLLPNPTNNLQFRTLKLRMNLSEMMMPGKVCEGSRAMPLFCRFRKRRRLPGHEASLQCQIDKLATNTA